MAKSTKNNWNRTKAYQDLKRSLLEDLNAAGMERLPFTDLVEQYMSLWCQLHTPTPDELGSMLLPEGISRIQLLIMRAISESMSQNVEADTSKNGECGELQ